MEMLDLYLGIGIMVMISAGLFLIGRRIAILAPRWVTNVLGILTIAGVAAYVVYLRDNMLMAIMLPYSNLVVLGNWFPVGVGFLGGLAWIRVYGGRVRKGIYTAVLLAVGCFALVHPLIGSPPECKNEWAGDICIQTTNATCSAACAATVLHLVGIDTEESEMARLSLTRNGTTWQGLYRGMKLKTNNTNYDVRVFQCKADELHDLHQGPKILAVGLERGKNYDPKYEEDYGWIPGQLHSVVLLGFAPDGRAIIGEPTPNTNSRFSSPIEYWPPEDLELLWRGIGLELIPRD